MKNLINKLTIPCLILLIINMIGFAFRNNYEGAVVGSIVGAIVAILILQIKIND